MRKLDLLVLAFIMLVAFAAVAFGKAIVETTVECREELIARPDDQGNGRLYVACVTLADTGDVIRGWREYDVTNRLTTQQKTALTNMLGQLKLWMQQNEAIPTTTPAP